MERWSTYLKQSGKSLLGRKKKKRPEGLFSNFHSPSDWPTYSLPRRYEENPDPSTGKTGLWCLFFHKKWAARNRRPSLTGRKFARAQLCGATGKNNAGREWLRMYFDGARI